MRGALIIRMSAQGEGQARAGLDDTHMINQNATILVGESHAHDPDPEEYS